MTARSKSPKRPKAVVLLSGGLDSTTCLALAKRAGYELYALTIRYGQRHQAELKAARRVAKAYAVKRHAVLDIDLAAFGGSALTDKHMAVPKGRSLKAMGHGIPATYVPARNTVFLSMALAWAEALGARHIYIGVNALDYSGYPDCRPAFIRQFERLARLATKGGVQGSWSAKIHTPLMRLSKADIVRLGKRLGVDYRKTHSCYDPKRGGKACGRCDSCLLRAKGFSEAGMKDPSLKGAVSPSMRL
jgi:7-cyano-7-deazaguanine synthase